METVRVFAPVNIAWIKYMGKKEGKPTNSSLSMTLDQIGTHTSISYASSLVERSKALDQSNYEFIWDEEAYVPPKSGIEKAEKFLRKVEPFQSLLSRFGVKLTPPVGKVFISTRNTVPASSGIATSASGFAALTLAWLGVLAGNDRKKWIHLFETDQTVKVEVAKLASSGSGSAGRSFQGPFVEWSPEDQQNTFKPVSSPEAWTDYILVSDPEPKKVPSSEAHERVKTSLLFQGRESRAEGRLSKIKNAFQKNSLEEIPNLVLDEALDMHELFHTSVPGFTYLNDFSKSWIQKVKARDSSLPSSPVILTLDAGSTIHLFVPVREEQKWECFFKDLQVHFYHAKAGEGAHYVD